MRYLYILEIIETKGWPPSVRLICLILKTNPLFSHAQEHDGEALWARVITNFTSKNLSLRVDRYSTDGLITSDDEITIDYVKQEVDIIPEDYLEASRAFSTIQKYFVPYSQPKAIEQALGPALANHYNRRDEELSRLEDLAQRITEDSHGHRLKLDAEYEERKKELNESIKERRLILKQDHNRRQNELITREEELEKRRKDLDDRTARHARREQSRRLQEKIATRSAKFTLTPRHTEKEVACPLYIRSTSRSDGCANHFITVRSRKRDRWAGIVVGSNTSPDWYVGIRVYRNILYPMDRSLVPAARRSGIQASTTRTGCRSGRIRNRDVTRMAGGQGRRDACSNG